MNSSNGHSPTGELRAPGYWTADWLRDTFRRIGDSLKEIKEAETVEHITAAAVAGHACTCRATSCQTSCPLGKEVPSIMDALKKVNFELIAAEFADVQQQLNTYLEDYADRTFEEFFRDARKGYIKEVKRLINEKPELEEELLKLHAAYKLQVGAKRTGGIAKSPFPEFTGILCPAPCEAGGDDGPGCTLKESGLLEPVRIRMVEYNLAEIGAALGWMDEIFKLPGTPNEKKESIAIVGSGPAGLQLAYTMRMRGYQVTLFEQDDEIGGLMYRGIPDHKFDKEGLVKYRIMLEEMGVDIRLGEPVTANDLEGFDAKVIATGVMDNQNEPHHWPGYEEANNQGLTSDAYGFLSGANEWVRAEREAGGERGNPEVKIAVLHDARVPDVTKAVLQGEQALLVYGDGYTATDLAQTLTRMKKVNPDLTAVQAYRYTEVSDQVAGGFSVSAPSKNYHPHEFAASTQDKVATNIMSIPGALVESVSFRDDDKATVKKATVKFSFHKPVVGAANVARDAQRGKLEEDKEVGGIYDNGELKGVRVRDANGELHDHAYRNKGVEFDPTPLPSDTISGDVNGTLELECTCIIPALGARDASKNTLVEELGVNAGRYHKENNPEGILSGVALSKEGLFFAGDAGHNEQLIVSAQADADRVADTIDLYLSKHLSKKRDGEQINLKQFALSRPGPQRNLPLV